MSLQTYSTLVYVFCIPQKCWRSWIEQSRKLKDYKYGIYIYTYVGSAELYCNVMAQNSLLSLHIYPQNVAGKDIRQPMVVTKYLDLLFNVLNIVLG